MTILRPINGVNLYKISTTSLQFINFPVKVKVKQSHYRPGPEGSRRLRLPDFMTIGT